MDLKGLTKLTHTLRVAMLAAIIGVVNSCSTPVDPISRATPPLETGESTLLITTQRTDGQTLTDYTVNVNGPVPFTGTVNAESFVLENITDGTYTVTVSKTGFIGQTKSITITVPTDNTADNAEAIDLFMTQSSTPVTVDNATGGTVSVPAVGSGTGGIGTTTASLNIPAGAITGTGTTDISVTAVPEDPENLQTSTNGTAVTSFVFEPDGLTFSSPVTVTIPLDATELVGTNSVLEYVNANGQPTGETVPVTIASDGSTGTAQITHFSVWRLVHAITVDVNLNVPRNERTYISDCSAGLNETFTISGSVGKLYGDYFSIPTSRRTVTVNANVVQSGSAFTEQTGTVSVRVFSYTITKRGTSEVLETSGSIPRSKRSYSVTYSNQSCHDSGG